MRMANARRFAAVNTYAIKRMREVGDVYAWAPDPTASRRAVLYVSRAASLTTFPQRLGTVDVRVEAIAEPELQGKPTYR
jgi:hypothetical protein